MDFYVGQIVKAKAGRDKDGFFIIKELAEDKTKKSEKFAYIVDGKRRKLENPKKKKLIHLTPTQTVVQDFNTNREVVRILSEFQNN